MRTAWAKPRCASAITSRTPAAAGLERAQEHGPERAVLARSFDTHLHRRDDDIDLLRHQPTFAGLPVQALDAVAAHLSPAEFTPGQTITIGGQPADRYVLVARGEVLVECAGVVAARRQVGDAFGFDGDTSRAVTVRAATAVSVQTIPRDTLLSTSGYDLDADVCTPITPWRPPDRPPIPSASSSDRLADPAPPHASCNDIETLVLRHEVMTNRTCQAAAAQVRAQPRPACDVTAGPRGRRRSCSPIEAKKAIARTRGPGTLEAPPSGKDGRLARLGRGNPRSQADELEA